MHWFRLVNAVLEVLAALLTVPLMRSIQHRGTRELRSFMIYLPILIWVVSAGLAISTGTLIAEASAITVRTWAICMIALACVIIEVILINKYKGQPRHLAKHQPTSEGDMPPDPFVQKGSGGMEYDPTVMYNPKTNKSLAD
jgi:hypothetical protein